MQEPSTKQTTAKKISAQGSPRGKSGTGRPSSTRGGEIKREIRLDPSIARRAIVLSEIIGPPVSKRRTGNHPPR